MGGPPGTMLRVLAITCLAACGSSPSAPDAFTSLDAYVGIDALTGAFCDGGDGNLVACYAFEPATPPTALVDGSHAGNAGTIEGGSFVAGYRGMAAHLVPGSSRIVVPESPTLDMASVTVEAWVEPDTEVGAGGRETIVDDGDRFSLALTPGNIVQCSIAEAGSALVIDAQFAIPGGTWSHVACTYDAATRIGRLTLNGAPTADGAGLGRIDSAGVSGIVIGGDSPCAAAPCTDAFSGSIDQLRVWSRARTHDELCYDADAPSYACY